MQTVYNVYILLNVFSQL